MEDALRLDRYLPLSFKTQSEQDYLRFLWDAFESNYENKKYQFAFLAYHMLTMSFIYFNIWQIKQTEPADFEKAMIGFNKELERELLAATSPFTFWRVNESSVMRFLKLIDEIQNHSAPTIQRCYSRFLTDSCGLEEREYPDDADQIREVLIHGNYLSQKDIELCTAFDVTVHKVHPNFTSIEWLHRSVQEQYVGL